MQRRIVIVVVAATMGCGDDEARQPLDADASGEVSSSTTSPDTSSSEDAGSSGGAVLDVAGDEDGPMLDECACVGTGAGIYVMSDHSHLFAFDPAALSFEHLGEIACPTSGWPVAMAVDRQGHALVSYVAFEAGYAVETFAIELADPSACEPYAVPLPDDRVLAGMGWASTSAAEPCDDLYVLSRPAQSETEGATLGRIAHEDGAYLELGAVPYYQAQLTGTADGRLFGFAGAEGGELGGSIASLVRFDIGDGDVIEDEVLAGLDADNGLGFAFWGGDVWFFTDGMHDTSIVTRLDYDGSDGGGTSIVVEKTPVRILGAGVSTCAPYVPTG